MTAPKANAGCADIHAAHALVKDLFVPVPWRYWRELLLTGSAAWTTFLLAAVGLGPWPLTVGLVCLAIPLWYRAGVLIHELTHQRRDELPGFHLAWNLGIGIAWLLPSVMYEGAHHGHHRLTTYGTVNDPEYLFLAGRPWAVLRYLGLAFIMFPASLVRFLIAAPLSWFVPPLRRLLIRSASSYVINLRYVRTMSRKERRRLFLWECVILLVWWPPLALTLAGELPWRWLLCWYAIYSTALFVNRLRMLSAHHFASDGAPTDHLSQFADSIDTPHGWWAELWAPLGLRYHALHHLFPTLPFHNMATAYRRLSASLPPKSFYHAAAGTGLASSLGRLLSSSGHNPQRPTPNSAPSA